MVSIGTARTRRPDAVSGSAIVLTANAGVLAFLTVIGALFLLFLFGDEDGTWQRLWPLVAGWVVTAGLATANAMVTIRFARRPADAPRPSDAAVALMTSVVAALLLAFSASTPGLLLAAAPFALANAAAAWFLYSAARVAEPVAAFPFPFPDDGAFTESDLDLLTGGDPLPEDPDAPNPDAPNPDAPNPDAPGLGLPDLDAPAGDLDAEPAVIPPPMIASSALPRRPRRRSRAALHTLRGIQLPRRARIR
ncbi:hypothetical protein AMIS_55560 [Actinoplanes missouriensis 431]|uniref:Uncharacterized protein n=1 Tax=Actinoplanes missouriensis (strain ATCC 14538 / DSM 43046 / CBS 188.64 / JCM 3121 / NBRC 102363 / NCIMB 12654 / NRRL B-3342 / UNCC 431) TaxID=512565 RepID=I0HCN9_ACTM4|nr:hypothetical protein [Actinoplanes missouriensis]BAL90776.1 hypothetical protein AMIS_55560 [Actinoplanes missouriensis 431]